MDEDGGTDGGADGDGDGGEPPPDQLSPTVVSAAIATALAGGGDGDSDAGSDAGGDGEDLEDEPEPEPETLLDRRMYRGRQQYLVRWVGSEEADSWEEADTLSLEMRSTWDSSNRGSSTRSAASSSRDVPRCGHPGCTKPNGHKGSHGVELLESRRRCR